jgi:signal peptidase
MAPAIPTGSLALVRDSAAADLKVGDVVTLTRSGERLPITHRIQAIEQDPAAASGRIIYMKGDANQTPDQFPYHASTGKLLLGSVPGAAAIVHTVQSPLALGGITVGAGLLVLWAFWPRSPEKLRSLEKSRSPRKARHHVA